MNKKCAFTIVAKNYIGLGQILGLSLRKHNPDVDFYIFMADEFDTEPADLPDCVLKARDVTDYTGTEWTDMTFKYNLTEFCTAIKPACFQHVFKLGYEAAIYFDPDIFVFSSIDRVFLQLEQYDVALTPQVAGLHVDYQGEHPEWAMNVNGIFNLGFCAMRRSELTARVLCWWRRRLTDNAFADRSTGNFTDQKWMDWMPGLLGNDHLYVFHELGMNMAPWNFFERQLFQSDGRLMVRYRTDDCTQREDPLLFIHFAGYDYQKLKQGIVERKRIENLQEYEDLALATDIYRQAMVNSHDLFDRFIGQHYSYATFDNGLPIDNFHRRLYHGLTLQGETIPAPFTTGKGTYYDRLRKKNLLTKQRFDNLNRRNIEGLDRKRRLIGLLFGTLYRLMGYRRYAMFLKSLYHYCRPELHTFLIKK